MSTPDVHLLPFSVDREGVINTKSYFSVEKEGDHLETVVLGRKLVGTTISLTNSSAQAHVYENVEYMEEDEEEEEDKAKTWIKTSKEIPEFVLWKKDTAPNASDPRINAIRDWIDISQAIHTTIPLP